MPSRLFPLALTLLVALSGCKDRQITSYRAPKDPVVTVPAPAAATNTNDLPPGHPAIGAAATDPGMAGSTVPTGSDTLKWTAPPQWTAMPDRPMRKATYAVKDATGATADLSITSFPGDTGGLLANLNRWRGQLGLPPLDEAALAANVTPLEAGELHYTVVDFAGAAGGSPTRILGAILPYQGETWFFKLLGPDAVVAGARPAFDDFLRSVAPR